MPNVGPMEVAIVALIALLIFGPRRLPELGKSLGGGLREFKNSITARHDQTDDEDANTVPKLEAATSTAAESSDKRDPTRVPAP